MMSPYFTTKKEIKVITSILGDSLGKMVDLSKYGVHKFAFVICLPGCLPQIIHWDFNPFKMILGEMKVVVVNVMDQGTTNINAWAGASHC